MPVLRFSWMVLKKNEHVGNYELLYDAMLFPARTLKSRCLFGKPLGGSEFDNIETNKPHCK